MTLVALLCTGRAMGLSDADHTRFSTESPTFAQAEKRLNEVWKRLRGALSKEGRATLCGLGGTMAGVYVKKQ